MLKQLFALSLLVIFAACGGSQQAENGTSDQEAAQPAETQEAEKVEETATESQPVAEANPIGEKVYKQYCFACHQMDGNGVPGTFPPLSETEWVNGDKERLIKLVLNGLQGEIEVKGETYNSVMTPHNFLSDEEIAGVLTYVRSNFGNNSSAVTVEEVQTVRVANSEG